jgi:hypothetical protein
MKCEWIEHAPDVDGKRRLECRSCGRVTIPLKPGASVLAHCGTWKPPDPDAWASEVVALDRHTPLGLGDITAAAIAAVGITKERWNAWQGEVGPCPSCIQRQEWLNKMGRKALDFLRGR